MSDSLTDRATTHRSHSCLAQSQDWAMTHQSQTLLVLVQGTPCRWQSTNTESLATSCPSHDDCLAALAEGVNTLFNGPDCCCCSTFTWLRKLSSTTSGSTPSSSSFCRYASSKILVRNTDGSTTCNSDPPPDVSSQPISQEAQACCRRCHHQIPVSCPNKHSSRGPTTTTEPKLKLELEQGTGRVTPSV